MFCPWYSQQSSQIKKTLLDTWIVPNFPHIVFYYQVPVKIRTTLILTFNIFCYFGRNRSFHLQAVFRERHFLDRKYLANLWVYYSYVHWILLSAPLILLKESWQNLKKNPQFYRSTPIISALITLTKLYSSLHSTFSLDIFEVIVLISFHLWYLDSLNLSVVLNCQLDLIILLLKLHSVS